MSFIPLIKAEFSASLLQSSVSHDPSEIIQLLSIIIGAELLIMVLIIIGVENHFWWLIFLFKYIPRKLEKSQLF